jgi:hypothetical protein
MTQRDGVCSSGYVGRVTRQGTTQIAWAPETPDTTQIAWVLAAIKALVIHWNRARFGELFFRLDKDEMMAEQVLGQSLSAAQKDGRGVPLRLS